MAARDLTLIALFAAITAVCAQVSVALPPLFSAVPFTLQVFAVLAAGAVLGARRGVLSQVTYLLLGAAGVPVFARFHGGAPVLVGPTGGYLWAFPIAAGIAGWGWDRAVRRAGPPGLLAWIGLACSLIAVYAGGVIGLLATRTVPHVSQALRIGVYPFVPLDAMKAVLAGLVAQRVRFALPRTAALGGR